MIPVRHDQLVGTEMVSEVDTVYYLSLREVKYASSSNPSFSDKQTPQLSVMWLWHYLCTHFVFLYRVSSGSMLCSRRAPKIISSLQLKFTCMFPHFYLIFCVPSGSQTIGNGVLKILSVFVYAGSGAVYFLSRWSCITAMRLGAEVPFNYHWLNV